MAPGLGFPARSTARQVPIPVRPAGGLRIGVGARQGRHWIGALCRVGPAGDGFFPGIGYRDRGAGEEHFADFDETVQGDSDVGGGRRFANFGGADEDFAA